MTYTKAGWQRRHDDRIADLTWLAESGEGATTAAMRMGMKRKALEEWCRRHNRAVWHQLRANEKTEWKGARQAHAYRYREAS